MLVRPNFSTDFQRFEAFRLPMQSICPVGMLGGLWQRVSMAPVTGELVTVCETISHRLTRVRASVVCATI